MWRKIVFVLFVLGMLPFYLFAGTTGKISGIVTNSQTGEPLIGVNVVIEGSMLGASTDMDGYYFILNVPVGLHTLKVTYMGYQDITERDIRVSIDLTTEANFQMNQKTLDLGNEVVVTAERKMIRKDETNTNVIKTVEEIENMPIRGLVNLAATTAGVIRAENSGALNVRGGRGNETATYIDGVLVTDPAGASMRLYIPNQAIEEVSVQTGGFNAEYGDAMSGIVAITTNAGKDKYHVSVEAVTDEFLSAEKKHLGTYSYGSNEYVGSISGPIIPKKQHTFYMSLTRNYNADATPSWGWAENHDKLTDYTYYQPMGTGIDSAGNIIWGDTVAHKYHFNARLPENFDSRWSFQGKAKFQIGKNIELKTSLIQTNRELSSDVLGNAFTIQPIMFFDTDHRAVTINKTRSINFTVTHMLSSRTFYDAKLNLFDTQQECYDPMFKDDLEKYGDPAYNPWPDDSLYLGVPYTGRIGTPMVDYFQPGCVYDSYIKGRTTYWGIDFDMTHQQGKYNTFKAGFEYKYHTIRSYRMYNPSFYANPYYSSEIERWRNLDVRAYGYDLKGNEVDEGDYLEDVVRDSTNIPTSGFTNQAPYHPIIISAYLQDKIEFKDIVLNLGLRYDYVNPNAWMFKQIAAEFNEDGSIVAGTGMFGGDGIFDKNDVKDSETYYYISPRFGVSFPVTENTIFHAQYGVFYQAPLLGNLYLSPFYLDRFVSAAGYFTNLNNPNLRPPKTVSYEVGFKQMLGTSASIQLTAFYKETEDNIQLVSYVTDIGSLALPENGDFGTIKGLDFIFNLRRTKNLSLNFNYELQFAEGTGSASLDNYNIAWLDGVRGNYPKFTQPLDFEQRHSGGLNVDYRLQNDAPIWVRNSGVNVFFSFNSGNPYTRQKIVNSYPFNGRYDNTRLSTEPISAIGAETTPWCFRVDMKLDRKFYIGQSKIVVYAWITNLLNSPNVQDVWLTTGLPDQCGFLGTPTGQAAWNELDETGKAMFKMREMDYNYYGSPRQIRLGVQVEL